MRRQSKVRTLAIVGLFLAASVNGQVHDVHDGHWWREQPYGVKVGYVVGCMDHVSTANPDWAANLTFERVPRFNDVCDRLDAFYAGPANRDVPVIFALPAMLLELAQPASRN